MPLVRDLEARNILDSISERHLYELTTSELISSIKRTVTGPESWTPSNHIAPTISCQQIMDVTPGHLAGETEARLLSGGRYVVVINDDSLECWQVAENKRVWRHESKWADEYTILTQEFAVEVIESGAAAMILICQCSHEMELKRILIEIVRLDLSTGSSYLLMHANRTSDTDFDNPFFYPHICGEIAIIDLQTSNSSKQCAFMLMNWKTKSRSILLCPEIDDIQLDITLIPGHMILVLPDDASFNKSSIAIYAVQSLTGFSTPSDEEHWNTVHIREIPPLLVDSITHSSYYEYDPLRISAHESPLSGSCYRIWLCITCIGESGIYTITRQYSFSLHTHRLRLQASNEVQRRNRYLITSQISFSGHAQTHDRHRERILCVPKWQENVKIEIEADDDDAVELEGHSSDFVYVSPYSGALVYETIDNSVVVNYYK